MKNSLLLEMKEIRKQFPGVLALDDARLELEKGEVHALLGENGAGKSTLIKVLGGIYSMDKGEIFIEGQPVHIATVSDAQQQMVEIVKAISFKAKIIVMDEPTSSLSDKEVDALFASMRKLKAEGIGIIYISHRMSELAQIADRVTVMRDGQYVGTRTIAQTTNDELIAMMVGRNMGNYYSRTFNACDEVVLQVNGLSSDKVHDVSFDLRRGEILGFSGLVGAGRSETMRALFGIDKATSGSVQLCGENLPMGDTAKIIASGISLVPENRRDEGIFPVRSVKFNLTLKVLQDFINGVFVNRAKEDSISREHIESLSIRTPNDETPISSLSGGNQQKVVIASWLATHPKVLILDEPTRGIDVGAKSEIYAIMNELAKQDVSIIMVSSELPEILNMSDRVVVMCDGTIAKILDRTEATQELIMRHAVKM